MANETRQIRIESILGGHSVSSNFARSDQFQSSLGIDPSMPPSFTSGMYFPGGILTPVSGNKVSQSTTNGIPMWLKTNPKDANIYVYCSTGSVYTTDGLSVVTGLGDLTDGGTSTANGMAYYDNYMYFARSTTIARYGPLNGTPVFTDDYWVTTLSKTALTDTTYPLHFSTVSYPNHILHRHSDGKLYIADVVGNQGYIHYISTTKTTVEGDTDNGSTYQKLQFGYGLWPTAIETYGSSLVIAFYEGNNSFVTERQSRAKIAFWDTTSANFNSITWVEFPDALITAIKNVNGVLYFTSSNVTDFAGGFRVSQYVGGYSFQDIFIAPTGFSPSPGAVDGTASRLVFGTNNQNSPASQAGVYSYGLAKTGLSGGVFNVMSCGDTSGNPVTSLVLSSSLNFVYDSPLVGLSNGFLNYPATTSFEGVASYWWSQMYKIGQKFKITKIRFPLAQAVSAGIIITPKIYTDNGNGTTYTLTAINNTNDSGLFNIVRRSGSSGEVITGNNSFWIELAWTGTTLCSVTLPITIEYELLDD